MLCGRPLAIQPDALEHIDGLLVCWLPGTEGDGVADVLFGSVPPTGRLSYSWPSTHKHMTRRQRRLATGALFPLGYGLTYAAEDGRDATPML